MIKDIRHVGIVVDDVVKAARFYKQLGFITWDKGMVTHEESFVLYGSVREIKYIKMYVFNLYHKISNSIELYEIPGQSGYQGLNHIAVTVDNVEKAWKFFHKKGLTMSRHIVERDGHRLFFAQDLDGNILELVEPPK